MPVSSVQFGQEPWQYANGLGLANDGTTPDEIVTVATGSILDSTGVYQLDVDTALSIDNTVSGLNGLDTGTVAASTVYAVYVIADPVTQSAIGGMISLASSSSPTMPLGYSAFALVGYITTDSSSDFLAGFWTAGNGGRRTFMYDAPIATAITAGAATTDTSVVLTTFMPPVENSPVYIKYAMTPAAASRTLTLKSFGAVGTQYQATSQVTAVVLRDTAMVLAVLNSAAPTIEYLWSAGGGDAVALNVAGYDFFI
jgi:hypothetical protein